MSEQDIKKHTFLALK